MSSPHHRDRRYKDASLRRDSRRNHLLFALAFAAACVYIGWLVTAIDWQHSVVGSLFLAAEIVCGVSVFLWGTMLATKRLHPKAGLPWEGDPPPVDVLIAVCHEPMEVVRPTLLAVAAIDYPHACVTVLDDGRSDELKAIAEQLGFAYSARERRHFAKSGNLNHGLTITSAPFVLALDADQVPHPEIIDRLVGFFQVRSAWWPAGRCLIFPQATPGETPTRCFTMRCSRARMRPTPRFPAAAG
jgi:cellulose synthase (UDP-forming)